MASSDLALAPETEGRAWSVRTWAGTYLVVRRMDDKYDVHQLADSSSGVRVEYVGFSDGQTGALVLIEKHLAGEM